MDDARAPLAETVLLGPPERFALKQETDQMVRFFPDFFGDNADKRGAFEQGFRLQAASGGNVAIPAEDAGYNSSQKRD